MQTLERFKSAQVVAGYVAMRGEMDPAATLKHALDQGKRVVLPTVDWELEAMVFRLFQSEALEESGMGFLQPSADSPAVPYEDIDFVITPALAVDERGHRIGWGGGFYDRALGQMPHAFSAALIYDFQLLMEVPNTPGDTQVKAVVTDERIIAFGEPCPDES